MKSLYWLNKIKNYPEVEENLRVILGCMQVGRKERIMSTGAYPGSHSGTSFSIGHLNILFYICFQSAAVPGRRNTNSQPAQSATVSTNFMTTAITIGAIITGLILFRLLSKKIGKQKTNRNFGSDIIDRRFC
jgi:hypothetical protein